MTPLPATVAAVPLPDSGRRERPGRPGAGAVGDALSLREGGGGEERERAAHLQARGMPRGLLRMGNAGGLRCRERRELNHIKGRGDADRARAENGKSRLFCVDKQ